MAVKFTNSKQHRFWRSDVQWTTINLKIKIRTNALDKCSSTTYQRVSIEIKLKCNISQDSHYTRRNKTCFTKYTNNWKKAAIRINKLLFGQEIKSRIRRILKTIATWFRVASDYSRSLVFGITTDLNT